LKAVLAEPNITLADLKQLFEKEKSVTVSVPTLWRELCRLNLRRKKNQWLLMKETNKKEPGINAK
jgi:hypothetical protein